MTGSGGVRYVTVGEAGGQRIDNYLLRELRGLPKSRIYRMLRKGEVRVNGARVKPTHRLAPGDQVRLPPVRGLPGTGGAAEAHVGQAVLDTLAASIVFEDEALLVLNKPAGMPVHGGSGLSFGVIEALRRLRPEASLELAHRLDRDTSGCLLVAKRRPMLKVLHDALRARQVKKDYALVVLGRWSRRTTTVQLPLLRYLTASGERRVRVAEDGKASRTDFTIRQAAAGATLLDARLHTGRTHQIRVHTAVSGHPVAGDEKYSAPDQLERARQAGVRRLCLHAASLSLEIDGARRRFEAPVPEDLLAAWKALA
jgi:23S rRNA pseudouridine955/2504/2580 synthase